MFGGYNFLNYFFITSLTFRTDTFVIFNLEWIRMKLISIFSVAFYGILILAAILKLIWIFLIKLLLFNIVYFYKKIDWCFFNILLQCWIIIYITFQFYNMVIIYEENIFAIFVNRSKIKNRYSSTAPYYIRT